ncbi:excalibur calcium-binding domain-containing protein [Colwellia sp. 4_MG-2023]|uniref:excalibur calcium-binding domain-containing protein n=1 Tax=unclassified Colwellia TaxID=196834 RepID=UPI001C083937|nr:MULTISPECIES: excalibur calcium-binding domain-containing protein [unclassified Colwellia]MBU2926006.1 excalibur calcium-binding domain-containing protein [Colwellia sp. C2M11]MDO6507713.1 excalibur calcium-binding domain-containing protein [Colwellia sp. 5_MG-2023]MDO6556315.1 excalibur calcium-binding domain-containing protein [Colwellia sp. 4_MG-2023]MDO6653146.1 excalibur calcium-binding domain-containing protein [Colwellia sp. 3_MG-2023]MDO6666101.1 excalibur calcium-binding domain-con
MYKGKLKNWQGVKGFGFIQSDELKHDVFIHISTLKAMSREPKVGDFIYFEVEKQANGKSSAVNCRIEGVAAKSRLTKKPRIRRKSPRRKNKLVLLLMLLVIGFFTYQRLVSKISGQQTPNNQIPSSSVLSNELKSELSDTGTQFSCDGRQYCSQMNSRAEAEFFTRYCPNTKMDGDNDGIPCENDSRF